MIRSVTELKQVLGEKISDTWSLVGKGPTFSKLKSPTLSLCLNESAMAYKQSFGSEPIITHVMDLEVLNNLDLSDSYLVMPVFPHQKFARGNDSLFSLKSDFQVLKSAYDQGRLFCYYSSQDKRRVKKLSECPVLFVRLFSAVVATDLVGFLGVKSLRHYGIDGGKKYAECFSHLKPLTNGQSSFSPQLTYLDSLRKKWGITLLPQIEEPEE